MTEEFWNTNCILKGYRGSIAHGTYIPSHIDDKDIMGVCVAPREYYIGLKNFEQYEHKEGEIDLLIYELRKYVRLLLKSNPNVLCLLWLSPNHYILKTEWGNRLLENRDIFISKQCYKSFTGYAYGQLRKMTHFTYRGYMGQKRKELVEKFGFDAKNAGHLIRLLKMGIELLSTGELNVLRHDSQQLIAIKQGEWTLEQVQSKANELFKLAEEAFVRSKLPEHPNYHQANILCMNIIEDYWKQTKSDMGALRKYFKKGD